MELKKYQAFAMEALERVLEASVALGPAEAFAREVARQADEGHRKDRPAYVPLPEAPAVPYLCLRLPTGGGKTILAAETVRLAARALRLDPVLALWMVPSGAILTQTVEALKDRRHAYRQRLDAAFDGAVRVLGIDEVGSLRPADLRGNAVVVVSTIQSFRVADTASRKVYAHEEDFEGFFQGVSDAGLEVVTDAEAAASLGRLTVGRPKHSFANLCHLARPLMIVDEAHNAVTDLTRDVQARLNPSAVVEFTATPRLANNVLVSVTAEALKAEEMIKLPIRVRAHGGWQAAVDAAVAERKRLEALGGLQGRAPVALYQAQPRTGEANVEAVKRHLIEECGVPAEQVRIATGEQRELDGVDLGRPGEPTRHVITVQALKEGWDCPTAYVLCATQSLTSRTTVEQLLGRVLRMPDARRQTEPDLNVAYAHVSEANFLAALAPLRGKLIEMGFTNEEADAALAPPTVAVNAQGTFQDLTPDPWARRPVLTVQVPASAASEAALQALAEQGVAWVPRDGGLSVGVRGEVTPEVEAALTALAPEAERPALAAAVAQHRAKVEAARTPAERGDGIELPLLGVRLDGEAFTAEAAAILERAEWSLLDAPADVPPDALQLTADGEAMEVDIAAGRVRFERVAVAQPPLPLGGRGNAAQADETFLIHWLERQCRVADVPQAEMEAWLARAVTSLTGARGIDPARLIDWRHELAAYLRARIASARDDAQGKAWQRALFGPAADVFAGAGRARLDAITLAGQPTMSTGAFKLRRHLLGPDCIGVLDGDPGGAEFQCALALDGLDAVEVWVRNLPRQRDGFWLPTSRDRFWPDFVARLTDGRLFVVEYKGAYLVADAAEDRQLGHLWAERTGNVFVMVEGGRADGAVPAAQMRAALARRPQ